MPGYNYIYSLIIFNIQNVVPNKITDSTMRDKIIGDVHIDFIRKYNKTELGTNLLNHVPVRV